MTPCFKLSLFLCVCVRVWMSLKVENSGAGVNGPVCLETVVARQGWRRVVKYCEGYLYNFAG